MTIIMNATIDFLIQNKVDVRDLIDGNDVGETRIQIGKKIHVVRYLRINDKN